MRRRAAQRCQLVLACRTGIRQAAFCWYGVITLLSLLHSSLGPIIPRPHQALMAFGGRVDRWLKMGRKGTTRIIGGAGRSAFLGSEFSFDDLSFANYKAYTYLHIEKEQSDSITTVDRFPKKKSKWLEKQRLHIDRNRNIITRVESYAPGGRLVKVATFAKFKSEGKGWFPYEIKMENLKNKRSSTLVWNSRKFGVEQAKEKFSSHKL